MIRCQFEERIPQWIKQGPETEERWNAVLQTLEGHSDSVRAVAFSPDGSTVASGSWDTTIKLWDARSGTEQATLQVDSVVDELRFSIDGSQLFTDRGVLDISSDFAFLSRGASPSPPGVYVREQWIVYGTERLLWLPQEYRHSQVAVRQNVVVLGCQSGRISFLEFDLKFAEPPPHPPP